MDKHGYNFANFYKYWICFVDISAFDSLNEQQYKAVTMPLGNAVVLAGAGSGKTRVLVSRIGFLISQLGLPAQSILAVTFTNKAAGEMKQRLSELLRYSVDGLWVGTFHGIAHRLLRRHYQAAGLPEQFQILDSDDQLRLVKRVVNELKLDKEQWQPKKAQWYINGKKDEGLRPHQIDDHNDPYLITMKKIYDGYQQACTRAGAVDFAELLLRAHELLLHNPELLAHYQQRFQSILIDEFQDTNTIQYAWICLLAGKTVPVMIVGDDDQSIYGWRGAKIENIHRFEQDFDKVTTVRLEQNYRSTRNILQAANALIENNADRLGKSLWTQGKEGEPVYLYAAYNETDEARFVIDKIKALLEKGYAKTDMALLYRSNAQSRVLEEAFIQAGIAYRIYGGLRFFERAEIKDVLSYLRLVASPNDDTAFERVVNVPTRGIGQKTVDTVRECARSNQCSLWLASEQLIKTNALSGRAHAALLGFLDLVQGLTQSIESAPLDEQVNQALTHSGLWQLHAQSKTEKAQSRLDNMKELVSAAKQFSQEEAEDQELSPLQAFLAHASLEAGEAQAAEDESYVQLMTMHAAKGLEFPAVFIVGLEEGVFPSRLSLEEFGRLEEERRLCYVAMTRAREVLYLSYAEARRLYGREEYHRPSRFIKELPEAIVEEVRIRSKAPVYQKVKAKPARGFSKVQGVKECEGFQLGQMVNHKKFGAGIILNFEGEGARARVQVQFKKEGCKWLLLKVANLQTA